MSGAGSGDVGQIAGWAGGFFISVGVGIRWLVQWLSGRQEKRIGRLERDLGQVTARLLIVAEALALLAAEHRIHSPNSDALARAERALKLAFPLNRAVPQDLLDLAAALDRVEA